MKVYRVGRLADLQLSVTSSAIVASMVLWLLISAAGLWILQLPSGLAAFGALLAVCLHWLSEISHHLGHAWVARRVGYPMMGLALFFCLENLLVFGLGALLPLGFTDGSTLLEWWPKR